MTDAPTYGYGDAEGVPADDDRLGYSYDTGLTSDSGSAVDFDVSNYDYVERSTGESVDYYDTSS